MLHQMRPPPNLGISFGVYAQEWNAGHRVCVWTLYFHQSFQAVLKNTLQPWSWSLLTLGITRFAFLGLWMNLHRF